MKIEKRYLLNYSILIPYLILSILGLIVVYSTTSANSIQSGGNPFSSVLTQGVFWIASLIGVALIYKFKLDFLKNQRLVTIVMWLVILLLIISRIFGAQINGARGWILLGPLSLQPAEYLKIVMIWYLASVFSRQQELIAKSDYYALTQNQFFPRSFSDWRIAVLVSLAVIASLPDLGNATILSLLVVIMISLSGISYRWFATFMGGIAVLSAAVLGAIRLIGVDVVANVPLFGYIAKRFSAFYNPFEDLSDSGHQLANSYYAMSNGGWFGMGLGNSIEKNGYLPEAHTDFVFAIVIEELGFVGASLILGLLFFLILRVLLVGIRARDPFNALLATGVGGLLLTQTFVNIGGISGLIPSTGVTFPFLSQGGNSLLVLSIAIAFVLNVDAAEKKRDLEIQAGGSPGERA
ncbi:FtsW/RodA/SpoVE family cell cycle protein [Streptococcus sp. 121]|uniref:cell division peptidoglycan polymerase FtsW n=1 Tax=Streptococcus sp. 121 TaxID=2797637 RepID=UPI0018F07B9D|nr:FtsW/RodA/SpoVE family cell cycle protein [Streptococcus sp. 121]MBJ6745493.1 FtsW/RodA/SpoVE family cell cycle protein [Streptococcus sp. 121]